MKMRFLISCGAGAILLFGFGCNSLDFDFFKTKEPEPEHRGRSPYSMLVESADGVRVVDRGNAGKDAIGLPESELPGKVFTSGDDAEKISPGEKAERKDTDALYKKLFPDQAEAGEGEYIKVAINFDAANLGDVIPAFASPLKMNYLLDPGVTGTVTMSVKANLRPREVWTLFEQILQLAGAYCEMENQVVHIRPIAKMAQEKKMFRPDSNIEVAFRPLKHVAAKEISAQIKNFLSDAATVTGLDQQNALLLVENSANMERLLLLIDQIDRKSREDWQKAVFVCQNIPASKLAQELLEIMPILGFPVTDGKQEPANGEIGLIALDRVQAIVVSAATGEALEEVRRWVKALDRSDIGEQERVYLYEVVNGKADELLSALSVIFPVESSLLSAGASSAAAAAPTGKAAAPRASGTASSSGTSSAGDKKVEKSNSIFDTSVKVFADAVHNRLLVRSTPRSYALVRAILDRMDTIPAQILMQVLVVEIELSDNNEFGIEFSYSNTNGNTGTIFGTNFEALTPNTQGQGQTGGTFAIFNPSNPEEKFGYIRALASKNKLKVLSSPQIVVKSNAKARFSVGKRVPIISNEITDTQSSVIPDNTSVRRSYQYEDTGIILNVTPQVTKGGMISMEIEQTISDAVENNMRGMDSPIIKEDVLETTLAIRDGRTIIMGGLIKEKQNEVISSLPWVIDIPFLRTLFSNTVKTGERTEILVLVTATIIREESTLEGMIRRYNQAIREIDNFEYRQYKNEQETKKIHSAIQQKMEEEPK